MERERERERKQKIAKGTKTMTRMDVLRPMCFQADGRSLVSG